MTRANMINTVNIVTSQMLYNIKGTDKNKIKVVISAAKPNANDLFILIFLNIIKLLARTSKGQHIIIELITFKTSI